MPGKLDLIVVENSFLGKSITVAGLLAGRDILRTLKREEAADVYLLPSAAVNDEGYFIDDLHLEELKKSLEPAVLLLAESLAEALTLIEGE